MMTSKVAQNPHVSICIPTYNGREYLKECLDSVRAQTFQDFEVVICDDQSSDGTLDFARELAQGDERFQFISNPRRFGLVGNWNNCLAVSRGEWIKFLFQDDMLEPSCLEKMMQSCMRQKKLFGFCHRHIVFDPDTPDALRTWFNHHEEMLNQIYGKQDYVSADAFANLCAERRAENVIGEPTVVLFHRSVIRKFGAFSPALIQTCDMEYWSRLGTNVGVVHVLEKLATFRVHGNSTTAHNHANRSYRLRLEPLLVDYLILSEPSYRNMRKALYRMMGRFTVWRRCIHESYNEWKTVHPSFFNSSLGDAEIKKEWKNVVQTYPGLRILAWTGFLWQLISRGLTAIGLNRPSIQKKQPKPL